MRVLFRRWYLTVPLLILTGAAATLAGNRVEPTYTASAGGVFLAPVFTLPRDQLTPNPWGQAGVVTTAAAVQGSVVNPTAKLAFEAAGLSGDYSVLMDARSVLFNTYASAPTVDGATATLDRVVQTMRDDLRAKQAQYRVPVDQQTTIQVFTPTSIVTTRDGLSRVLLVVGGLGVVGSVAVVLIVDALLMRRVRRRELKPVGEDELKPDGEDELKADGEDELKLDGARA